ncbi:MAG: hypothetical protein EXR34_05385 [Rhodoferax sp.]|nr:hypothetical protein [Rhodoferax sp.]
MHDVPLRFTKLVRHENIVLGDDNLSCGTLWCALLRRAPRCFTLKGVIFVDVKKGDHAQAVDMLSVGMAAALVLPLHTHRHRYFGVLAPNSPLRAALTAMAMPAVAQQAMAQKARALTAAGAPSKTPLGIAAPPAPKRAAHTCGRC